MSGAGDQLVEAVLADPSDEAADRLRSAFAGGYPIDRLRLLLTSRDERVVRVAAWIASEVPEQIGPVVDDVAAVLLKHDSRYARFFALDAVLGGAGSENGRALAAAMCSITDSDAAVRWKALRFLVRATNEQLVAGISALANLPLRRLMRMLVEPLDEDAVTVALTADDTVTRLVSVATAARHGVQGAEVLRRAAQSNDSEVRSLAQERIEELGIARA